MSGIDDLRHRIRRFGAPVTVGIVVALVAVSLASWLGLSEAVLTLALNVGEFSRPWAFLTYPFAFSGLTGGMAVLFLIFLILWMVFVGGTVERDLGSARFAAFWAVATLLGGILLTIGASIVGVRALEAGPSLPVAALTVAWGSRYPNQSIMLYGIVPVAGKWLAWLTAAVVLFGYGSSHPVYGLFAVLTLVPVALFGMGRLPISYTRPVAKTVGPTRAQRERDEKFFDDVRKREKEREERERLRKLFEGSLKDDEPRDR